MTDQDRPLLHEGPLDHFTDEQLARELEDRGFVVEPPSEDDE